MVVVDITGVVSDDEHIQALGFRDVLKEMFADNTIALKNLEATLSNDDEKCVEWYFDNLKGKVNQQRDIISKNIYPISEEERNEMRNRIYACLPKPEPVKGIKETLNSLKGRKDIDVVYVSAGSSGRKKLVSFGIESEDAANVYINVSDREKKIQEIIDNGGYDKRKVINVISSSDGVVKGVYNVAATQFCRDHCSKEFSDKYDDKIKKSGADIVVGNITELGKIIKQKANNTIENFAICTSYLGR